MRPFPSARALIVGALLAPCGSATVAQTPAGGPVTVLRAARMVDTKKGVVVPNPVILVQGGRITAVGSAGAIPAGATVIDLGDATILPGLIDSHTHLLQNYNSTIGGDDPNMLITVATMSAAN